MTGNSARSSRRSRPASPRTRAELMEQHAAARQMRQAAQLGSDDYRAAAEEVARIEIAIAEIEEPPPPDIT